MLAPASKGVPLGSCSAPPPIAVATNPALDAWPGVPTLHMVFLPAPAPQCRAPGSGLTDPGSTWATRGQHSSLRAGSSPGSETPLCGTSSGPVLSVRWEVVSHADAGQHGCPGTPHLGSTPLMVRE
uniref:Uncharacterized protein n=1 Tax=Molossus molossus TaxID=27622 RepID=A0A7J8BKD5_MOLMO|nr:hypothetical protein HJG59_010213 [Molossus molossus]